MTDPEFREAFRCHKDVLYRYAYRMTGSPATGEDVVQDCFVALWQGRSGYDQDRGPLRAYLLGIARNLILKRWRREHPSLELDDAALVDPPIDLLSMERDQAVKRAVESLPPLQREVLILAEYEEMALEEIADATQAGITAVKSRLHRARQNLRRALAPLLVSKGGFYGTSK